MTDITTIVRPHVIKSEVRPGVSSSPVASVFGRIGAVVAAAGDYAASLVTNDSSVAGATVQAALNTINTTLGEYLPRLLPVGPYRLIVSAADMPSAVGDVITAPAGSTWLVLADVDLPAGQRIECDGIVTITGLGPETCKLRSSSLGAGASLISSASTLTLRAIGLYADTGRTCVTVDGTGAATAPALDWSALNFNEGNATPGTSATLINIGNNVNNTIGVFGDGYHIQGSAGSVVFSDSILVCDTGQAGVTVEDAAGVISRRMRLTDCVVALAGTGQGIVASDQCIALSEGLITSFCNFSGPDPSAMIVGVDYKSDKARFVESRGVPNSSRLGEMTWSSNTDVTTISSAGAFVRAEGTSAAGTFNQRFEHPSSNLMRYKSQLVGTFKITITASMTSGNNQVLALQAYKDGSPANGHVTRSTSNGNGRAESMSYMAFVQAELDSEFDVRVANLTSAQNIVVEDLVFHIEQV